MAQYLRGISQIRSAIDSGSLSDAEVSAIIKNGVPDLFRSAVELLSYSKTVEEFQTNNREVVSIFLHIFGGNLVVVHEKEDLEFLIKDDKWKELTPMARRSRRVTQSQKLGLFHKFGLREKYPKSEDAGPIIGIAGSTLRQFDSAKKKFEKQHISTALGYLCDGTWDITKFRNASEALEKAKSLQYELKYKVGVDIPLNENIPLLDAVNCEAYLPNLEDSVKDLDEAVIYKLRTIENFPKSLLPKRELGESITKYFSEDQCHRANVPLTARIVFA